MNNQHTQARLRVPDDGTVGSIETEDGNPIGHTFQVSAHDQRHGSPIRRANASRLVACWNACAGISTESLERSDMLSSMNQQRRQLEAQLDQLLTQMKAIKDSAGNPESVYRIARDAIAACQPVPAVPSQRRHGRQ